MTKRQDALDYHANGRPGKIAVVPTKPLTNQRDLSLAYSPGVAEPCLEIEQDHGSRVHVHREGQPRRRRHQRHRRARPRQHRRDRRQAGDGRQRRISSSSSPISTCSTSRSAPRIPDDVIKFCQLLEPTVGGINLEDIRAPDCFYIEETLRKTLKIPVFHDDQHGTAIISGAALLNALEIVGKDIARGPRRVLRRRRRRDLDRRALRAARRAAREHHAVRSRRRDLQGPHAGDMDPYKARFHVGHDSAHDRRRARRRRRVRRAVGRRRGDGRDGPKRWRRMPIIFALANPVPEILPEEVRAVRDDAIIATGRSDYPNQVNNVLGFPFIFRGALDVRATEINEEMKMAATRALALLAKENVPDSVAALYGLRDVQFGPEYLIPFPFDPRVLLWVAPAVAWAAVASGAANDFIDLDDYRERLESRLGRARGVMRGLINRAIEQSEARRLPRGRRAEDHSRRAHLRRGRHRRCRSCSAIARRSSRRRAR